MLFMDKTYKNTMSDTQLYKHFKDTKSSDSMYKIKF